MFVAKAARVVISQLTGHLVCDCDCPFLGDGSAMSVCFTIRNRRSSRRKLVGGVQAANPDFELVDSNHRSQNPNLNLSASPVPLQRYTPLSTTADGPGAPEVSRSILATLHASQAPDVTPQAVEPVVKLACKPEAPGEVEMSVSCDTADWTGYFVVIQGRALDGFHPEAGTTFEGHCVYRCVDHVWLNLRSPTFTCGSPP